MTPENFCFWLQGWYEINGFKGEALTAEQSKMIQDHLQLVFIHAFPQVPKLAPAQPMTPDTNPPLPSVPPLKIQDFIQPPGVYRDDMGASPLPFAPKTILLC